jgi:translocation and assembly module TamB
MMTLPRWLKITLSLVLSLLLVLIVALTFLLNTTSGLRTTIRLVGSVLPGKLSIEHVEGTLLSQVQLSQLHYQSPNTDFSVKQFKLRWQPKQLFAHQLHIDDLELQAARFTQKASSEAKSQSSQRDKRSTQASDNTVQLPVELLLDKLNIDKLAIDLPKQQSIVIRDIKGQTKHQVLHLTARGEKPKRFDLALKLDVTKPSHPFQLKLNWQDWRWTTNNRLAWKSPEGQFNLTGDLTHYQGRLQTRASGRDFAPLRINGQFEGNYSEISQSQWQIRTLQGRITASAKVQWRPTLKGDIRFKVQGLKPQTQWPKLSGNLNAQGAVLFDDQDWTVDNVKLSGQFQNRPLSGVIHFKKTGERFSFGKTHLQLGNNKLTLSGGYDQQWTLAWQASLNELQAINPNLQGKIQSRGHAQGNTNDGRLSLSAKAQGIKWHDFALSKPILVDGKFTLKDFEPHGLLDIDFEPGVLRNNAKNTSLPFRALNIKLDITKRHTLLDLLGEFSDGQRMKANLKLPRYHGQGFPDKTQKLTGRVQVNIPNIAAWQSFVPVADKLAGSLNIDGKLSGTLGEPRYQGQLKLADGELLIRKWGLNFKNIAFKASGHNNGNIRYSGKLDSNAGQLNITGRTHFKGDNFPTELEVRGNNFQAFNSSQYEIRISPDVKIKLNKKQLNIAGKITVPEAKIAPTDFSSSESLSDDVVFEDEYGEVETKGLQIMTQLNVQLGKNVHLKAFGLTGFLRGHLQIKSAPNAATTGLGQIRVVKGEFKAYGHELNIDNGQLLFTGGPLDNPGLNVRASKTMTVMSGFNGAQTPGTSRVSNLLRGATQSKITVGVLVVGRADAPKIQLFSEPTNISQANILSYLVLGRSTGQVSSKADTQLLVTALSSLNLGGHDAAQISQQLQKDLGVQIDIESIPTTGTNQESAGRTAVFLTKALTPRLYLSYGFGVFATNIIRIRYLLTNRLTLQSETSGNGNGVDLLYTFERG